MTQIASLFLASASVTFAQESTPAQEQNATGLSTPSSEIPHVPRSTTDVMRDPSVESDAIWARYHNAALSLADGDEDAAVTLLRRIQQEAPDHPAAIEASRLLHRLGGEVRQPTRSGERRRNWSRIELVAGQTIHGAGLGNVFCAAFECSDVRAWTAATLLGGITGFSLAIGLSGNGVTPGQAQLYRTLPRWGYYNGWLLSTALGINTRRDDSSFSDFEFHPAAMMGSFIVSHALSLGAAVALDYWVSPTAGDIALMDSFMIISSSILTMLYSGTGRFDGSLQENELRRLMGGLLIANLAALGLSGWLTTRIDFTRRRALLVNLGAGAGMGVGMGLYFLVRGKDASLAGVMGGGIAGMLLGTGVTFFLTRKMKPRREPRVDIAIAPTRGGATATLQSTW